MDEQLIDLKTVAAMFAVGGATIKRWCKDGNFPPPIRFGGEGKRCKLRWLKANIQEWLQQQNQGQKQCNG